jgi:hypothetical protein
MARTVSTETRQDLLHYWLSALAILCTFMYKH